MLHNTPPPLGPCCAVIWDAAHIVYHVHPPAAYCFRGVFSVDRNWDGSTLWCTKCLFAAASCFFRSHVKTRCCHPLRSWQARRHFALEWCVRLQCHNACTFARIALMLYISHRHDGPYTAETPCKTHPTTQRTFQLHRSVSSPDVHPPCGPSCAPAML